MTKPENRLYLYRMLKNIKLLIFDVDGTLVDSSGVICEAFNGTTLEMGLSQASPDAITPHIGLSLEDMYFNVFGKRLNEDEVLLFYEKFRRIYDEVDIEGEDQLQPSVVETLEYFINDKQISVATTKPVAVAEKILAQQGLLRYFSAVFGGDSVENIKPDPEIVHKNLAEFNVEPHEAVIIGDTTLDVLAGKGAGIHTVSVLTGAHDRATLAEARPDYIIETLEDLKNIVA